LQGGDVVWNIGTGYFSTRTPDGKFSVEEFAKRATLDNVKMIEIKFSQGAKPVMVAFYQKKK
jgi:glutamate synthase domain-containing protein 2